jgi:hypothetical protein
MAITPNFSSNFQRQYTSGGERLLAWKNGGRLGEGGRGRLSQVKLAAFIHT